MREVFSSTVTDPRVTLSEGTFDKTGVEDGWADIILIVTVRHSESISKFTEIAENGLTWNRHFIGA